MTAHARSRNGSTGPKKSVTTPRPPVVGGGQRPVVGPTHEISPSLDLESLAAELPELASPLAQVKQLTAAGDITPNTLRAYAGAFKEFVLWARPLGLPTLPTAPEVVLLYVGHLRTVGTHPTVVNRARYGIAWMHSKSGLANPVDHPAVRTAFKNYGRWWTASEHQRAPIKAHPLSIEEAIVMIDVLPQWNPDVRGVPAGHRATARELARKRMKAELLVGWQLGRRLDELVRAEVDWVLDRGETVAFTSSSQKRKPDGHSNTIHMTENPKLCAITALREWLTASQPYRFGNTQLFAAIGSDADHPLCLYDYKAVKLSKLKRLPHCYAAVLTPEEVEIAYAADAHEAEVQAHRLKLQNWMRNAGIQADDVDRRLGGHSLRRGLVTELLAAGVDPASVAQHVGWANTGLVLAYSDHISPDHPIARLGI